MGTDKTTPKAPTPKDLGDLARALNRSGWTTPYRVLALIEAVLEYEAYVDEQVARAIEQAKRLYPADWAGALRDEVAEIEWQAGQ